jgi:hypothetical protein
MRIKRPTPALIVAFLALFIVVGGSATAARLITGKQIRNGSIGKVDLAASARPQPLDYQAPTSDAEVPNDQIVTVTATCPPGYRLTGGGMVIGANDLVYADSIDGVSYDLAVANFSTLPTAHARAQAFCVRGLRDGLSYRLVKSSSAERARAIREFKAAH